MTKDRLQSLSFSALKEIAKKEGIINYRNLPIEKLIEVVIETLEEERNERITSNNTVIRGEEKKYDIFRDEEIESQDENEYSIPDTYNETKIALVLVEPLLAYAYWDFSEKEMLLYTNSSRHNRLILRVHEIFMEESKAAREEEGDLSAVPDFFDIPIKMKDRKWYINLPSCNTKYYTELVIFHQKEEKILCTSSTIISPAKTIEDIKNCPDFISEDLQLLAGFYDFDDELDKKEDVIPQRIISFIDDKYLTEASGD